MRAGLVEQNTKDILKQLGLDARMNKEGVVHDGVYLSFEEERIRIPFAELTNGRTITIYGQQEITKDLIDAWLQDSGELHFETKATKIVDFDTKCPKIHFEKDGEEGILECDFVAACDGFHGIGRKTLPKKSFQSYDMTYPYSWLGILANVAPSTDELIYSYHKNGFALHSLRSATVSRLYLQVDNDDSIDNWSDDRIWSELSQRLAAPAFDLEEGPIFEKGITPMRSYMIDSLRSGRLLLAGDAAHIVPPTGGKGMNLAIADVKHMVAAFVAFYKSNSETLLDNYTDDALRRIWRAQDFSNFMTKLFHKQDVHGSFAYRLQKAKFDYLKVSKAYRTTLAENYVGLPFESFEI